MTRVAHMRSTVYPQRHSQALHSTIQHLSRYRGPTLRTLRLRSFDMGLRQPVAHLDHNFGAKV